MAHVHPVQPATIPYPDADGAGKRVALPLAVDHENGYPEIVERHKDPLHARGSHMTEDELVDVLNDLRACCRDGEQGYQA